MNIEKILSIIIDIVITVIVIAFVIENGLILGLLYFGIVFMVLNFFLFIIHQLILINILKIRNKYINHIFDYLLAAAFKGIFISGIIYLIIS